MLFTWMWNKCTQHMSLSLAKGGHKIYSILLLCLCFMKRDTPQPPLRRGDCTNIVKLGQCCLFLKTANYFDELEVMLIKIPILQYFAITFLKYMESTGFAQMKNQ